MQFSPARSEPRAQAEAIYAKPNATPIGGSLTAFRPDVVNETDPARAQGRAVYLLIFEIVSVHLLVVLVGAAYLARAKTWNKTGAHDKVVADYTEAIRLDPEDKYSLASLLRKLPVRDRDLHDEYRAWFRMIYPDSNDK